MPEEPRLADDVDPNKLLVEIVQGLLMAHARLDHMEAALRQAVEKASQEHLHSFDKNLSTVDVRFRQATVDANKAVASLEKVRSELVISVHQMEAALRRAVEKASEEHLNSFDRSLSTVDLRFKQTTDEANKVVSELEEVQNNLVYSVQQVSLKHYEAFKSDVASIQTSIDHLHSEDVASIQKNIDHLRTAGVLSLAAEVRADRLLEQQHFDDLQGRLKYLTSNGAAQKDFALTESNKQSENWKNLHQFLQGLQTASASTAADLKKHTAAESKSLSKQISAAVELINTSDANHYADLRRVRILLYWLIFFSASLIGLLAATTFRLWIR